MGSQREGGIRNTGICDRHDRITALLEGTILKIHISMGNKYHKFTKKLMCLTKP